MMSCEDFLIEIHTEELPPKTLFKLAKTFANEVHARLQTAELAAEDIHFFATPRRLALFIKNLAAHQPDKIVERKGPALNAAFDQQGKPSPACAGFAKSCGVLPSELITIKTSQGEWVGIRQTMKGKSVNEVLPALLEQALIALPIAKRMRWSNKDLLFARPIHSVMMLYGDQVLANDILGFTPGRTTRGHRFLAPNWLVIPHPAAYASLLEVEGYVIADFVKRRELIREQAIECVQQQLGNQATILMTNDDLLNEITGLVEWPVALCGKFAESFLTLPKEVLISSMQDHQRYFPVVNTQGDLLPHFVTISNIASQNTQRVIHGNERVLRARLADAHFFFSADKEETLAQRIERLKNIVFQAKLGTLYDKAKRLSQLAEFIADKIQLNKTEAARAGWLAKTDLTTNMVNEFPELQGVMGYYYARDEESENVAIALREHYLPRFAGDHLPKNPLGQVLAVVDRLDNLLGAFGIQQTPTGDKDPYGLRRAALGVLRILIENRINIDLREILDYASTLYTISLPNGESVTQLLKFLQERLRAWYQEQGVTADVFSAVAALDVTNPLDIHERIQAVQAFKKLNQAETLSLANKRVSNILAKYADRLDATNIDSTYFENAAEQELAKQLEIKSQTVARLYQAGKYNEVLLQLADLHQPIDDFFAQVMVMTEDKRRRENRILLLKKLRTLFLQVADIALLQ